MAHEDDPRQAVRRWIAARLAPAPDVETEWLTWCEVERCGTGPALAALADLVVDLRLGQREWIEVTR